MLEYVTVTVTVILAVIPRIFWDLCICIFELIYLSAMISLAIWASNSQTFASSSSAGAEGFAYFCLSTALLILCQRSVVRCNVQL